MDNTFHPNFRLRRLRRRRKNRARFLLLIFIGLIVVFIAHAKLVTNVGNLAKRVVLSASSASLLNNTDQSSFKEEASLENTIEKTMQGVKGTYAVAVKNLKNGQSYYFNEHRVFEAGSLYKLWIMGVVYQQIQDGKLTEDQSLSEDVAILNQEFNIDPDLAELAEGTVALTVHEALYQMITISHNYAALLLTEKIKLSSVAAFLKANGLNESIVGTNGDSPAATPYDIALFFEKLYRGELANQQYTQEMIDLLKDQQLNDGLPKYLPDQSNVANKTGDIGWFKHDGGIVFTDKGDYTIVVMSESDFPPGAQEKIALVSKAVYDYFQNRF